MVRGIFMRRRAAAVVVGLTTLAFFGVAVPNALAFYRGPPPYGDGAAGSDAGYRAEPSGGISSASADFTVPIITCPSSSSFGVWPGLFVGNPRLAYGGGVQATCSSGSPVYEADLFIGTSGNIDAFSVAGGDKMSVEATITTSTGAVTITIEDLTHPASKSSSCLSSCETIIEAWLGDFHVTSVAAVPTFTSNAFTDALVNGDKLGSLTPKKFSLSYGGVVQVAPSAISKTENFTSTFKHN